MEVNRNAQFLALIREQNRLRRRRDELHAALEKAERETARPEKASGGGHIPALLGVAVFLIAALAAAVWLAGRGAYMPGMAVVLAGLVLSYLLCRLICVRLELRLSRESIDRLMEENRRRDEERRLRLELAETEREIDRLERLLTELSVTI